ncbi:MAG: GIY-YIG nuclease family protein [Eubacteriales bacterium]|nr:GIY-YIG nuclease family protein [Eubacteriales bacterium]
MKNNYFTNIPSYTGIGVYALVNNRNGKMYIGASSNIHKRIMQHKYSPSTTIKKAVESGDTFRVEILEKLPSGSNQFDMFEREQYFIDFYDAVSCGYNKATTTCCTKKRLLNSLKEFRGNPEMTKYILDIIEKRERPIYTQQESEYDCYDHIDIRIRVPKGQKAVIKAHAEKLDESMNQFVTRAITETMERDNA